MVRAVCIAMFGRMMVNQVRKSSSDAVHHLTNLFNSDNSEDISISTTPRNDKGFSPETKHRYKDFAFIERQSNTSEESNGSRGQRPRFNYLCSSASASTAEPGYDSYAESPS